MHPWFAECPPENLYAALSAAPSAEAGWLRIDWAADSLAECARSCYAYRYCYSLQFSGGARRPCTFFLHLSAQCAGRELRPVSGLAPEERGLIECLRCVSEEEKGECGRGSGPGQPQATPRRRPASTTSNGTTPTAPVSSGRVGC